MPLLKYVLPPHPPTVGLLLLTNRGAVTLLSSFFGKGSRGELGN